ncbi:hypothetical protein [Thiobacillus sp.]|uniref:hypothetical protein n=1 Tax=Thiobacillus sp. TaxID=924 RepID=UPI0017A30483|nr:hypothetical protein [Thiobacillus sp.]MBC2731392.1 hypothetical protein [Thiobacillus sp.]MBC2740129.1 hypothetical protein [Thiobacillus sp.]MBC2758341.1 hypothetical protein [Thiobacillus sp.]
MTLENRTFDFVSALTGVFALVYLGGAIYALVTGKIEYDRFLDIVGTPALPLVAWWAKGRQ